MRFIAARVRQGMLRGLLGKYYSWTGENPPDVFDEQRLLDVRVDEQLSFRWWDKPTPKVPAEYFGVEWSGYLRAPVEGEYRLYVITDDGSRVWLDGELVIDAWRDQAPTVYHSRPLHLSAGLHELLVRFYNRHPFAVIQLGWIRPDGVAEVIPSDYLVTKMGDEVEVRGLPDGFRVELWSGEVLASSVVRGGVAVLDVSGLKEPVDAYFKVYDGAGTLVFESPVIRDVWGGDIYHFMAPEE